MNSAVRPRGAQADARRTVAIGRAPLRYAAIAAVLGVAGLCGSLLPAGAAAPAPTPQAQPALDWLSAQLAANGGTIPGFTPNSTDWGLTADSILAFSSAGQETASAASTATDLLTAHASDYTTWTAGADTVREAGATGKVVLTLRSMGRPAVAQGIDLEAELRSLMVVSGPDGGRFSDRVPDPTWNAANGFGQALSMLGLALTDGGVPAASVTFLLGQQCPSGGFRLNYTPSTGCTADAQADTDATAMALQALLAGPRSADVRSALERGTSWLLAQQRPDGSWGGTGPTSGANSNSTGLIAQYLRAAGVSDAADRGAAWISSCCQLTMQNAADTPAAADAGAIAYNEGGFTAALTDGVTSQAGDQWRRATAQAVLAFGLAPYGPHDVDPLPDVTTTTTTSTTSTPTTSTTTASTTTSTTPSASSTLPQDATPTPARPDALVGGEQVGRGGGSSSSGGSDAAIAPTGGSRLATTGSDPSALLGAAVLLLAVGAVVVAGGRREHR